MNKKLVICVLSLCLYGCGYEVKKINLVDYGFKEDGILYIRKIEAISRIYENTAYAQNHADYPSTSICIDFAHDGHKKKLCLDKYHKKELMYSSYPFTRTYYYMVDIESKPIKTNVENLVKLEKKLHQVASDYSFLDSFSELINKVIKGGK
jgi:hypothetical protein